MKKFMIRIKKDTNKIRYSNITLKSKYYEARKKTKNLGGVLPRGGGLLKRLGENLL